MRNNLPVTDRNKPVNKTANILSTTDTKGHIKYVNREFTDIAGFSVSELINQPHNIIRHPDMPSAAFGMLWGALKSGRSWKGIVKNRCKNGDHYWVDAFATPIINGGKPVEFQSVRTCPEQDDVNRAIELYKLLDAGKQPSFMKRRPISLTVKTAAIVLVGTLFGGVLSSLFVSGSIVAANVISIAAIGVGLNWLLSPIKAVVEKAKSISSDPIAMNVYTGRNDEAGQLMFAIKVLQSETGGIVGRIADDASNLVSCNATLTAASKENTIAVEQLYKETEAVATAINEMSASIQEVASTTLRTAESANKVNSDALQSGKTVINTKESIESLAAEIAQASEVIKTLETDSIQINSIVDVIRAVAEQTNLLALNAAIEAARAGEHGRGFAVVADEVRSLANRTHESTKEITVMIDRLQVGTKNAVESMSLAQERVTISIDEANKAANSIAMINQSVENISDMSAQVASAVEEQSMVVEEINRNITRVMNYSDEISKTAQRSDKGCEEVRLLSERLSELASQFWSNDRKT